MTQPDKSDFEELEADLLETARTMRAQLQGLKQILAEDGREGIELTVALQATVGRVMHLLLEGE